MMRVRLILLILVLLLGLSGCEQMLTTAEPQPILVTLPAQSPAPTNATQQALSETPPVTEETAETPVFDVTTPTAVLTQSVPASPAPQGSGIGSTRQIWEWTETSRPSAAAASNTRIAVIIADGRFAWINVENGNIESSAFLWNGILQGESWGEVYVDGLGTLAVAAIREQSINSQTGLADSRARLAVYDAQAAQLWSLPELPSQRFYSAVLTSVSVVVGKWPQGFDDNSLASYELYTGEKLWEIGGEDTPDAKAGYQQVLQDGNRLYVLVNGMEGGSVAAFDVRTGEELWRWSDENTTRPDSIALGTDHLYVVSVNRTYALDPLNGRRVWWIDNLHIAPEAGVATRPGYVYLAPSPAAELGFRPGLIGLKADGTGLAWHALGGLLAEPVASNEEGVWTIVKDYDSGEVWLSGLEPTTGLEKIRLPVSRDPQGLYQIVPFTRRIYVLGRSLLAFGY